MPKPTAKPATRGVRNEQRQEAVRKLLETPIAAMEEEPPSILRDANRAVNGERQENYGDQHTNFTNIADIWTVVLREKLIAPITPQEVAMCQIGLKLARLTKTNGQHRDSIVDIAGYAECLDKVNNYRE